MYRVRRPCSDFTDMLRRLINCRIIIITDRRQTDVRTSTTAYIELNQSKCALNGPSRDENSAGPGRKITVLTEFETGVL